MKSCSEVPGCLVTVECMCACVCVCFAYTCLNTISHHLTSFVDFYVVPDI